MVYTGYKAKGKEIEAGEWKYKENEKKLKKQGNGAVYVFNQPEMISPSPPPPPNPPSRPGEFDLVDFDSPKKTENLKEVYLGQFVDDLFSGFGIFHWSNGNKYLGDCKKKKKKKKILHFLFHLFFFFYNF